jgi:hypothetical protein
MPSVAAISLIIAEPEPVVIRWWSWSFGPGFPRLQSQIARENSGKAIHGTGMDLALDGAQRRRLSSISLG